MSITPSRIEKMIYIIRNQKVMLDSDLAELYGVETKNLNKAVKRNITRFPSDFMFQLDSNELDDLRFQIGTANTENKKRFKPYVFTESGVAMLSGILNSERAVKVNISIMRTFAKIRTILASDEILAKRMTELEKGTTKLFRIVFDKLDTLDNEIQSFKKTQETLTSKRKKLV